MAAAGAQAASLRTASYNPGRPAPANFTNGQRVIAREYDDFDRLTSETVDLEDGNQATLSYTYWNNGLRKSATDALGRVTFYEYNGRNLLSRVTVNQGLPDQQVTSYEYWPDSLLKTIRRPNGTETAYTYDLADRVLTIVASKGQTRLLAYEYAYDDNGNRLSQVEENGGPPETTLYEYDDLNRLHVVTYPGGRTLTYGYDAVGNRVSETERDATGTVTSDKVAVFDAINRLSTVTDSVDPAGNATFTYDRNGNLRTKTTAAGTQEHLYDVRDVLVETREGESITARFAWDAFGRRYLKIGAEGIRQYLYDQTSLLEELDEHDHEVAKYEYAQDHLSSFFRPDEPRRYFHLDALGSVTALSDAGGDMLARYHLDAWGNFRHANELDASRNRFGFTGYLWDQETSLFFAKARFYDPTVGRFTTQDSYLGQINDPPSLHRYFYAGNRPTYYLDPTGHWWTKDDWKNADRSVKSFVSTTVVEPAKEAGKFFSSWGQGLAFRFTGDEKYRTGAEAFTETAQATEESLGKTLQSPQRLVMAVVERNIELKQEYDAAFERGDAAGMTRAWTKAAIQLPMAARAGSGVKVTPAPGLVTAEGVVVGSGGTVTLTPGGTAAAGRLLASNVKGDEASTVQENTPSRENSDTARQVDAKGTPEPQAPSAGAPSRLGVPEADFAPNPNAGDYVRPRRAGPTAAQSRSVQGQPCTNCGTITPKQVADHKEPLSVEHFRTGKIDVEAQRSLEAVQAHCPTCSAEQGGFLSSFVRRMREVLGIQKEPQ